MSDSTVLHIRRRRQPRAEPALLKVPDVAERLGVHPRTVRRWIRRGQIPYVYLGDYEGAPVRIPLAALEEWWARRTEGGRL